MSVRTLWSLVRAKRKFFFDALAADNNRTHAPLGVASFCAETFMTDLFSTRLLYWYNTQPNIVDQGFDVF